MASCPAPLGRRRARRALLPGRLLQPVLQVGVERDRLLAVRLVKLQPELFLARDPLELPAHERLQARKTLRRRRADVDRELRDARHDVESPRLRRDDADVGGHVAARACLVTQSQHRPRRAGKRVSAKLHRRRSRMVRLAEETRAEAEHPRDRRDDAEIDAGALKHRALLDVELQVGAHLVGSARVREPGEVETRFGHRRGDAAAAPVLEVAVAAERAAAQHPRLEAGPFLVVEGGDPDWSLRLDALGLQAPHDVERREDAEGAVVPAPAGHRVQVRAEEHRLAVACLPAADDVARRVELDCELQLGKTLRQPRVRLGELARPRKATDPAARVWPRSARPSSRSAVSDGTAPPIPPIRLDHARDGERDGEGEQEAVERTAPRTSGRRHSRASPRTWPRPVPRPRRTR